MWKLFGFGVKTKDIYIYGWIPIILHLDPFGCLVRLLTPIKGIPFSLFASRIHLTVSQGCSRSTSVVVLPSNERPSSYWKDMSFISKLKISTASAT